MSDDRPQVTVRDNPDEQRYDAFVGDRPAGFAAYEVVGGLVVFVHTEVDDAFEGHGVGSALVRESLDDVRARGLRVRLLCPFYAAYVERHPQYADLLE